MWLGRDRGYLSDWITQCWVTISGRRIDLHEYPWLRGPTAGPEGIGKAFFDTLAAQLGLDVCRGIGVRGLLQDFRLLAGPAFDPADISPEIVSFYERTSGYEMDAWAEWSGFFRPFGRLLAHLFSRRLGQLNVPLSALDTSRGVTSEVLHLVDPLTGAIRYTAWVRTLLKTGQVLYCGSYSVCQVPGHPGGCVHVTFPLPNGNAIVIMRPRSHPDGSLSVTSSGDKFGDPGFYFTVHRRGIVRARYLRSLQETIHVYPASGEVVRADHTLSLWGAVFLRLHYRLRFGGHIDSLVGDTGPA